jgi:hypothetical protein
VRGGNGHSLSFVQQRQLKLIDSLRFKLQKNLFSQEYKDGRTKKEEFSAEIRDRTLYNTKNYRVGDRMLKTNDNFGDE